MLDARMQRLTRPLAAALAVFLLAGACVASLVWHFEALRADAERARGAIVAGEHAYMLQSEIEHALSATHALAVMVRQGNGTLADFDSMAGEMLPSYPGAAALGLAPEGVVRAIVPLAGNEKSIGHDMLADPARATESRRARDSGELTLAGPFNLVQGGVGAVARLPVFLGTGAKRAFWGFTTVLLRFPAVLAPAHLSQLSEQGLAYQLWRVHPDTGARQVIAASSSAPLTDPTDHPFTVANATWTLSVAPARPAAALPGIALKSVLSLLFSAMLGLLTKLLLDQKGQQRGLQALVARRTGEIQASRHHLQATIDAIPDLMWELGAEGLCHGSHCQCLDTPCPLQTGRTVADSFAPDAAAVIMAAIGEAGETGWSRGKQYRQAGAGGPAWFELSVARKSGGEGRAARFIVLARDISERKAADIKVQRLTQLYSALSQCNQAIVRCASEEELFRRICHDAVVYGGMKMAWIGLIDAADGRIIPAASYGDELHYLDQIVVSAAPDSPFGGGVSGCAVRTEQAAWSQDFLGEARNAPWHMLGERCGWGGAAALPLYRNGVVIGVFSLYAAEINAFDEGARGLLEEMAVDISFALDNFVHNMLRRQSEAALRSSQARYRAVTQFANDAIVTADSAGDIVGWNLGAELMFGYAEAEAVGCRLTLLMPERYRARHCHKLGEAAAGAAIADGTHELTGLRKDGAEFPIELSLARWDVAEGAFFTGVMRDISKRKQTEAKLALAAKVFEQSSEGIMITDAMRNIVLINHAFVGITGYAEAEAIGQNPRMLSSGRHDGAFYAAMWDAIDAAGQWQGEVWNRRKDGGVYPEWLSVSRVVDPDGATSNYIGVFSDISHNKETEEHILRLGHFDPLTGLANRILLTDRISHDLCMAQRSRAQLAVLFLDLDHFKHINDSLGHGIGDKLLIEVAARLKSSVREQDTLSRLGGDEFILVLPDTDAGGAAHVAEKLLDAVVQTYWIDHYELVVTPSIGIAVYPCDGQDYDTLFKCADAAMYRAKQDGRNHYRFFTAEMQAHSVRTLQLEIALRSALKRNQLTLHYQPQIALVDGRVIGAEALLRWQHPDYGLISPAEFIGIAEDSGQILAIGEWVLRTAMAQLKGWLDAGLGPMTMAVNLSAVQFRYASLPELVMQILDEVDLPAWHLELELTESAAMENPVGAIAVMDKLRERGIRMAIDDFGTGYSSLSYLKRFQVYKLKIDQSFVRDITDNPEDKLIVGAIIGLAKSLGLETIAEGVETPEQLAFLREKGCGEVQGFYFSQALPADAFEAYVRQTNCAP